LKKFPLCVPPLAPPPPPVTSTPQKALIQDDVHTGCHVICYDTATLRRTRLQKAYIHRDAVYTHFAGPFFTSQLSCSFTLHASMRCRRCPQEKCGLPSADCHGTLAVQQLHLQMYTERSRTQHLSVRGGFLTKIVTTQQSMCRSVITNCNPVSRNTEISSRNSFTP